MERRDHLENGRVILFDGHAPRRKRPSVAHPFNVQHNVGAVVAAANEVRVHRMRKFVVLDGGASRRECARGDEPAKQSSVGAAPRSLRGEHVTVARKVQQFGQPSV